MNAFMTFYHAVPAPVWAFIFGTPTLVLVVNLAKKLFGVKSTLVIHSLTATSAFLLTALPQYILNNPKPFSWLGAYTTAFFTGANFLYAAVKVLTPFFRDVEAYEAKKTLANGPVTPLATTVTVPAPEAAVGTTTTTAVPGTTVTATASPTVFQG